MSLNLKITVSSKSPNIIISSKCETIFGSDQNNYAFRIAKDIVETFAFQNNPNLRYINNYAFHSCTKLRSVDLSMCTKLEKLGSFSFSKCLSVTTFILPEGLKVIGYCAISELSITTINIPSSVTYISDFGVSNMRSLKNVTFSKGSRLTILMFNTFITTGLTTFTIPEKISSLNGLTFSDCASMETIYLDPLNNNFYCDRNIAIYSSDKTKIIYCCANCSESYTVLSSTITITSGAFTKSSLKNIYLPDGITSIQNYAFTDSALTRITLPKKLVNISKNTFQRSGLTSIIIPDSVELIDDNAFDGCRKLKTIVLPSSLKSIGGGALPNYNDVNITFANNTNLFLDKQYILYSDKNTTISQFLGSLSELTIPNIVTIIKTGSFKWNTYISSISFSGESNLQYIEYDAFKGCTNLRKFDFGSKIVEIQYNAFENTILDSEISFPDTLKLIGDSAFKNCKFIPSIIFESLSSFYNKQSYELYKQLYSNYPLTIRNDAFSSCSSICEIVIYRETSISLGQNTFIGLISLTRFTFCDIL